MRKRFIMTLWLGGVLTGAMRADAQQVDHTHIQEGLPLRIDDATPIAYGSRQVHTLFRYERSREKTDTFVIEPRLNVGFARRWEAIVSVPSLLGNASRTGSGNFGAEALYNLQPPTASRPALGVSFRAEFPTGSQSAGVETLLRFHVTHLLEGREDGPTLHFNVGWKHHTSGRNETLRDGHLLALAFSQKADARTTFLADFVWERNLAERQAQTALEVGLRRQLNQRMALSLGIGVGIGADASPFRTMLGLQFAF